MPTYDYVCDACGHKFEKFQSMKASPLKHCPVCGKNKLRRLIGTGAGLIFKGSGFYITDYRSDSYKEKAKAESGTADSKPATGDAAPAADGKKIAAKPEPAAATPAAAAEPKPAPKPEPKSSSRKKAS